jgi:protein-disulfide isomerase
MAASDNQKRQPGRSGQNRAAASGKSAANTRTVAQGKPTNQPRTVAKRPSVPIYFYVLLLAVLVVGGLMIYSFVSGNNQRQVGDAPVAAQQIADKGISRGNPNAKVIFMEFGDFQCPGCKDFSTLAEADFKAKYVDTNQVREVWMNYPLTSIHNKALKAAEAGMCANEQGKFWEFHDIMYANQGDETTNDPNSWVTGDENTLWKQYAQQIGIDGDKLMQCVQANKYDAQIQETMKVGDSEQLQGTPSFLINHVLLFGAGPDQLYATIASEAKR